TGAEPILVVDFGNGEEQWSMGRRRAAAMSAPPPPDGAELCGSGCLTASHRVELLTSAFRFVVSGFDGLDSISQCLSQEALAADPDHDPERPSLEVLALADHDYVYGGDPVRL